MLVKALAVRLVVSDLTVGVGSTSGSVTRVHTFPVATSIPGTCQLRSTISVGGALVGVLAALGVGITH